MIEVARPLFPALCYVAESSFISPYVWREGELRCWGGGVDQETSCGWTKKLVVEVRGHLRVVQPPFNDEARAAAGFHEGWYLPLQDLSPKVRESGNLAKQTVAVDQTSGQPVPSSVPAHV